MSKLQAIRGTHDLLPTRMRRHRWIIDRAREISARYGFQEMSTPIFEKSEVFQRTLGESSDIVNKEMYSFPDKGGDLLTLRPEGTASIARCFISEGLKDQMPLKFFYQGPMFRYERPQKGRQRQFHQFGLELIGVDSTQADLEVIACASLLLETLGLKGRVQLEINSLGDTESRQRYRQDLLEFLKDKSKELSEESQKRLTTNPLRILDSKNEEDQRLLQAAPSLTEYLTEEAQSIFAEVKSGLDLLKIPYTVNPRLVRGLDYYRHSVFEFKCSGLGAQDTVLAGGRYDGLIELMGGPPTPAVGWAAGVERLEITLEDLEVPTPRPVALIALGCHEEGLKLAQQLRAKGFTIEMPYSGNLGKRMKKAHKAGAWAALILGSEELQAGKVSLKNFETGQQEEISLNEIESHLEPR